jgi:predicted Zn-dependent protease
MKAAAIVLAAAFLVAPAAPAHAQLGGLGKIKSIGDKAVDTKNKIDDLSFSEDEERQLGEQVSLQLRNRFGVMQDEKVTRYVTLVGTLLAQASSRPKLDWKFIVLDTDGVNAFATPGGFVHVTRGLLGLMKNEAELAGVLGHELTHVTAKHTIRAIQKSKSISLGADASGKASGGGVRGELIKRATEAAYKTILEGDFNRDDERESDEVGAKLANTVGYAPNGIGEVLKKIEARNGSREERNGMFASHPATKERISNNEKLIKSAKLNATATAEGRYKQNITFEAKPITEIATSEDGAAGLAGSDKKKDDDKSAKKEEEPKKKGGIGSALSGITGNKQQASSQQASSAGARGGVPDRDAKGGPNKNTITVKVSAAELDAFKKGIGA